MEVSLDNSAELTNRANDYVMATEGRYDYAFSSRAERAYSHRSAQTSRFAEVDSYLYRLRRNAHRLERLQKAAIQYFSAVGSLRYCIELVNNRAWTESDGQDPARVHLTDEYNKILPTV